MNEQNKNKDKSLRSGERRVRNNLAKVEYWHKWRYNQALEYIDFDDSVIDVGMGVGYGSAILSQKAKNVIGVDDSKEAVVYARKVWIQPNIEFVHADALSLKQKCDVVVAFEIVEHLQDDVALFNTFKELEPEYIVISTPHKSVPTSKSRWHWKHYTQEDLAKLLNDIGYDVVRSEEVKFKSLAVFVVGRKRK